MALIYVKFFNFMFFNFLNLNKCLIISSILLLLLQITSLLLVLNIFSANFLNNLVVFKIEINSLAILLKSQIKY